MMIETSSPPKDLSDPAAREAEPHDSQQEDSSLTTTENAVEPENSISAVKKGWGTMTAGDSLKDGLSPGEESKKKKSLMEIMAEEEAAAQESKRKQREESANIQQQQEQTQLMAAIQASLAAEQSSGAATDEMDEDMRMALMLSMQDENPNNDAKMPAENFNKKPVASGDLKMPPPSAASVAPTTVAAAVSVPTVASVDDNNAGLTEEELKEIESALQEADAAETAKSLQLALDLQNQEDSKRSAEPSQKMQGNVRTMSRAEFLREQGKDLSASPAHAYNLHGDEYYNDNDDSEEDQGFRINASNPKSAWARSMQDGGTIIGPNQEVRTKHDVKLHAQSNAYRLEVRGDDGERAHVGNRAYNSFKRSMQKKTIKGVAAHGHGRANADTDKTREGALDGRVRLQIARATNQGLIEQFHGCVKEGKEALVFHAAKGTESEGFDVAVKVFKRIQEFKNRGAYVAGDPRYRDGQDFRHAKPREQLEQWAEKEFRNLVRAYRSQVPVPKPLLQKENVLFMRFLGDDGWPSPQIRELDIKKGSKKWTTLYEQTMHAMQLLYNDARLIHGDLSEYNILCCPAKYVRRVEGEKDFSRPKANDTDETSKESSEVDANATTIYDDAIIEQATTETQAIDDTKVEAPAKLPPQQSQFSTTTTGDNDDDALRIVLIDFGQSVDLRHPEAEELLRRDVLRVKEFFDKMGITTIAVEAAMAFVQTKDAALR